MFTYVYKHLFALFVCIFVYITLVQYFAGTYLHVLLKAVNYFLQQRRFQRYLMKSLFTLPLTSAMEVPIIQKPVH